MLRFEDLVEGGAPEELARLRRAHDALLAAGPPPELPQRLSQPPRVARRVALLAGGRRRLTLALAAALTAAAFGVGFFLGNRGDEFPQSRAVAMRGLGATENASARIVLGEPDSVGNWPMLLRVRGLKPLEKGWYELYLTKDGKKIAPCGPFAVKESGTTEVRMSVPYELDRYDGWVIVAYDVETHETGPPLLTTENA